MVLLLLGPYYIATHGYCSASSATCGVMADNGSTGSREHNGPDRGEAPSAVSMRAGIVTGERYTMGCTEIICSAGVVIYIMYTCYYTCIMCV